MFNSMRQLIADGVIRAPPFAKMAQEGQPGYHEGRSEMAMRHEWQALKKQAAERASAGDDAADAASAANEGTSGENVAHFHPLFTFGITKHVYHGFLA